MTSRRSLTLPVVLALVLVLALAAFATSSFADGRPLTGVLLVVAALAAAYAAVLEVRRRDAAEISQGALADWPRSACTPRSAASTATYRGSGRCAGPTPG
ncbi:hypothetical protein ACFQX8_17895 [Klenkia terrae]|uniref:hypothetical protein n=1 Tax=Klenkia terrae TaxID=1052259 RepID=UPI0036121D7A